jgi:hypothetical protein
MPRQQNKYSPRQLVTGLRLILRDRKATSKTRLEAAKLLMHIMGLLPETAQIAPQPQTTANTKRLRELVTSTTNRVLPGTCDLTQ